MSDEEISNQPWKSSESFWSNYDEVLQHNFEKGEAISRLKMKKLEEEKEKMWQEEEKRYSFWNELGEDSKVIKHLQNKKE
jgi:siroheme synthase (precorrin-2 oxidase/ferrochelatase)